MNASYPIFMEIMHEMDLYRNNISYSIYYYFYIVLNIVKALSSLIERKFNLSDNSYFIYKVIKIENFENNLQRSR